MGNRVSAASLHPMAQGVAQVEQLPGAGVKLVLLHQVPFLGHAPGHRFLRVGPEIDCLQPRQQGRVSNHAVFNHLGAPIRENFCRESVQGIQVTQHCLGLVKHPR